MRASWEFEYPSAVSRRISVSRFVSPAASSSWLRVVETLGAGVAPFAK